MTASSRPAAAALMCPSLQPTAASPHRRHKHRHNKADSLMFLKTSLLFLKHSQEAGIKLTGIKSHRSI